jgi:hypothetical protein
MQNRWSQLSLRALLIVAMLGPPLVAGSYFFFRAVDAPLLAVVGSVVLIGFWTAIFIRIVSGWFRSSSIQSPRDHSSHSK